MLPDIPGTEVCRRIRGGTPAARQPAVIMLTAKGEEIDRVVGFELGADDYVVKPFSVRELVLRVSAILRARRPAPAAGPTAPQRRRYIVGPLELDVDGYHVFVERHRGPRQHAGDAPARLPGRAPRAASARARTCSKTSGATSRASRPAPSTPTSSACATSWAPPAPWSRPCAAPATACQRTTRSSSRTDRASW